MLLCGSSLLVELPDDILAIVTRSLTPRDVCNLCVCCRSLYNHLGDSDKVWLTQCNVLDIVPQRDLVEWRKGISSYKALCRFLVGVQPLIGIWVHQNPELGNVVYVIPGFISFVGCRIIPQELGPLGLEDGPILWVPVFEIVGDANGSAAFFLHGRDKENDYFYPGSLKAVDRTCNVLLLEVEPKQQMNNGGKKMVHSKSFAHHLDKRRICRSDSGISKSQRVVVQGQNASTTAVPFNRLSFGDRRKLLETVTSQVRLKVPESANGLLFTTSVRGDNDDDKFRQDMVHLSERRSFLLQMYNSNNNNKVGGVCNDWKKGGGPELPLDPTQLDLSEIRKSLVDRSSGFCSTTCSLNGDDHDDDDVRTQCSNKKKTLSGYLRDSMKQILGKSNFSSISSSSSSSSSKGRNCKDSCSIGGDNNNKHAQLHEFLRMGDTIGLTLHASSMKLSFYRAWPNMHDSRFALYKLPMQVPSLGVGVDKQEEYAGLWGGTFGWPPGRPSEEKPGKALFFLLLSYDYDSSQGKRLLIGTKILEGTHYVLHPNGSAMFIVNVDEPSFDPFPFPFPFPWDTTATDDDVDVKHAFTGEGIANGYGFRYPGSRPGSLFVIRDELLAFIWKESKAVLTLQRLNLQHLLKKGERVPALPPIPNFSYLTKSYSNVFAGFANTSNALSSPR